jgi:hypothetical protein
MSAVEQWRWLPGHEGWTEVSDHGRVRRWYQHVAGRLPPIMLDEPAIVTTTRVGAYQKFSSRGGASRRSPITLHEAVLRTFVGPRPDRMMCCHFPDPNGANCALSNLRWDGGPENWNDLRAHRAGPAAIAERLELLRERFPWLQPSGVPPIAQPPRDEQNAASPVLPQRNRGDALAGPGLAFSLPTYHSLTHARALITGAALCTSLAMEKR